ncbi:MAG: cellulose biosynthesis protein, partial [Planctomycetota bacterium]
MASVIEINDLRELEGYRLVWTALLAETPRASFFHTFEWVETYWRHFGEGGTLRVLVVEAGGKPIGIVPLCVKRERRQFGQVRVLTYPLDGWGTWYSPVGGAQAATLTLAMRHIASTRRDWDLIDLPWVDADGSDRGRTERAITAAGMRCGTGVSEVTSVVELQGGWDDYLAGMPSKARCEVRRNERRLHAAGEVEHVRWRPAPAREGGGEPAWELYNACEDVARRSWQAGLTDGNTLSHRRCRPFLREAHAAAAKLGMVDMNLLRINGET